MMEKDIIVGDDYQLTFYSNLTRSVLISHINASLSFVANYNKTAWGDHEGRKVRALSNLGGLIQFHFLADPPDCYTALRPEFLKPAIKSAPKQETYISPFSGKAT